MEKNTTRLTDEKLNLFNKIKEEYPLETNYIKDLYILQIIRDEYIDKYSEEPSDAEYKSFFHYLKSEFENDILLNDNFDFNTIGIAFSNLLECYPKRSDLLSVIDC